MKSEIQAGMSLVARQPVRPNIREFLKLAVRWIEDAGYSPSHAAVKAEGFTGKTVSYSRIRSRLDDPTIEDARHASIMIVSPEDKSVFDPPIKFGIGVAENGVDIKIGIDVAMHSMWTNGSIDLAARLTDVFAFHYGYCFVLPYRLHSGVYPWGMGVPYSTPAEEWELRRRWQRVLMWEYEKFPMNRTLRQVYRLQFLSRGHLELPVGDGTLRSWIERDEQRGQLTPLTEGELWTWLLTSDEAIAAVNVELFKQGILSAWDSKFSNPYPQFG